MGKLENIQGVRHLCTVVVVVVIVAFAQGTALGNPAPGECPSDEVCESGFEFSVIGGTGVAFVKTRTVDRHNPPVGDPREDEFDETSTSVTTMAFETTRQERIGSALLVGGFFRVGIIDDPTETGAKLKFVSVGPKITLASRATNGPYLSAFGGGTVQVPFPAIGVSGGLGAGYRWAISANWLGSIGGEANIIWTRAKYESDFNDYHYKIQNRILALVATLRPF